MHTLAGYRTGFIGYQSKYHTECTHFGWLSVSNCLAKSPLNPIYTIGIHLGIFRVSGKKSIKMEFLSPKERNSMLEWSGILTIRMHCHYFFIPNAVRCNKSCCVLIVTLSREQKNYCSSWWILLHYEQPSITTHFNIVGLITRVPLLILQCTKRAPFYSRHRDGLTLRIIALRMKVDELDDDESGRVGVDLVVRLGVWRVH